MPRGAGTNTKRYMLATACAALALVAVGWWMWTQLRHFEYTPRSYASWTTGRQKGAVRIEVVDYDTGQPVTFVPISVESHSGGLPLWTDQNGVARVEMGADDLEALYVGDLCAISRPYAFYIGPSAVEGLNIRVRLKGGVDMCRASSQPASQAR